MSEENKIVELKDGELEKVTGGLQAPNNESGIVTGFLYQRIGFPNKYAYVTGMAADNNVRFYRGIIKEDGKVHKEPNYPSQNHMKIGNFNRNYDLSICLSGEYWAS